MAGSGCGQRPGGRRTTPGDNVGSGRDTKVRKQRTATDGGGGRTEEGNKNDPEMAEIGGAGRSE